MKPADIRPGTRPGQGRTVPPPWSSPVILTQRLRLCPWRDDHRAAFARMHADAEVMADQGGPRNQAECGRKFDRYVAAQVEHGISRWAVENTDGLFLGYAGVMPDLLPGHPLGPHFQIGWRFVRDAWGHGYATESAGAALQDAFRRPDLNEVLSYTGADNLRSQAVMARLGLRREPWRDFVAQYDVGLWRGLVWAASRRSAGHGPDRG